MKKFLINVILLSVIFLLPAIVLNYIVDCGLRKSDMKYYYQWSRIYNSKINADVLICGSSRALVHVSPKIMDSILNVNSYNIGVDGYPFSMQYARFKIYLEHNRKPKYIIQCVDCNFLTERDDLYSYQQFIPFINDSIIRNETENYKGAFTFSERHFPLFKYNSNIDLIKEGVKCYFNFGKREQTNNYKGYIPVNSAWDSSFDAFKKANPDGLSSKISDRLLARFNEYLMYCKANDIRVILEFPPVYFEETRMEKNLSTIVNIYKGLSAKYDIPYLDYTADSLCYDQQNFYNSMHLNKKGSEIFSAKLANDLRSIIHN